MSFNQCQECWEQNDNLKENNRVLSENLRESNDKRFELFEKVGELNKAYADLKEENEKLREALQFYADENNYTKDGIIFSTEYVGQNFNINPEISQVQDYGLVARQALGIK